MPGSDLLQAKISVIAILLSLAIDLVPFRRYCAKVLE